jgi:mannose-6-phosphate isomerase-like protein (cupin superfamily)
MATRHQQAGDQPGLISVEKPAPDPQDQQGRILSARQAALWLRVNLRTAQLRDRRALRGGDPLVRPIAGTYCALGEWWQKILAKPIAVGRPRGERALSTPDAGHGQTIFVTEGIGRCQRRGGPIEVIHVGDRVFFEPCEEQWHGFAPNRFKTQLAMLEVDEQGKSATWGECVTDEEYGQQPE